MQAAQLDEKLQKFEQEQGVQFIVYTFPSLEGEAVEDFTIRCAEKWKVGNKKYDNGLILFVFVKERKVRVEVGYGLEGTVTDAFSSRVIREYIAPHFQQNDYAGGLNAAADALIAKIKGGEAPVPPVQQQPQGGSSGGIDPFFIFIIVVIFFIFILPMLRGGRRGRGCGGCFWPMFFFPGGGTTFGGRGGGWGGGGFGGGFGGGGGFSGGGGSFGGGGATGGW